MEITSVKIRRTLYLSLVRPALGYSTQVWSPDPLILSTAQSVRVERRATKHILNLPFICKISYKDRLISPELLPISYWHEYLDLMEVLFQGYQRHDIDIKNTTQQRIKPVGIYLLEHLR